MGLYLVLLHLQAWRHRASTRGLASLLPAAEATCAPRELLPGPLLNAGTPIFHSYRPSAPLPPELSTHARRLRLCSAPRTLHLDQASLLSKVLLSESSRYIGRRPCTWPTFHRASRPQSWAHWGGDEADGVGGGPIESRSLTVPLHPFIHRNPPHSAMEPPMKWSFSPSPGQVSVRYSAFGSLLSSLNSSLFCFSS